MTDVLDPAPLVEAAQEAAAAGDYSEAERLLREAAAIQEVSLGTRHPDLASTLNNLALVCERTNKFDEAERGYRRAHAIAVASHDRSDHSRYGRSGRRRVRRARTGDHRRVGFPSAGSERVVCQ